MSDKKKTTATKKAPPPPPEKSESENNNVSGAEDSDEEVAELKAQVALQMAAIAAKKKKKAQAQKLAESKAADDAAAAKALKKKKLAAALQAQLKALEEAGSDDMELDDEDEKPAPPAKKKAAAAAAEKPAAKPKPPPAPKKAKNPNAVEFEAIDAGIEEKPKKKAARAPKAEEGGDETAAAKKKAAPRKISVAAKNTQMEKEAQQALDGGNNAHLNCFEHSGSRYEDVYPLYERLYSLAKSPQDRMILKIILPIRMGSISSTLTASSPTTIINDTRDLIGGRDNTGLLDVYRDLILPIFFTPAEALIARKPSGSIPNEFLTTPGKAASKLDDEAIVEYLVSLAKDIKSKGVRKEFFKTTILRTEAATAFFAVVDKCMAAIANGTVFVDNDDTDNKIERKVLMLTSEEASLRKQFEAAKKEQTNGNASITREALLALRARHAECVKAKQEADKQLTAEDKAAATSNKKEQPYPDIFTYGVAAADYYYVKEKVSRISETSLRWRHVAPFKFKSLKRVVSGAASLAKMKVKTQQKLNFEDSDLQPFRAHYVHVANGGANDFVTAANYRMDDAFKPSSMLIIPAKNPADPPLSFGIYTLRHLQKMRESTKESVAELSLHSDEEKEDEKDAEVSKTTKKTTPPPPPPPSGKAKTETKKDEEDSSGSEEDEDEEGAEGEAGEEVNNGSGMDSSESSDSDESDDAASSDGNEDKKGGGGGGGEKEEEEEDSLNLDDEPVVAKKTAATKRKAADASLSSASKEKPAAKKARINDPASPPSLPLPAVIAKRASAATTTPPTTTTTKKKPTLIDLAGSEDEDLKADDAAEEVDDDMELDAPPASAAAAAADDEDDEAVYSSDEHINQFLKNTLGACEGYFSSDPAEYVTDDADDDRLECIREEGRRLNSLSKAHTFYQAYPTTLLMPSLVELEAALDTASRLGKKTEGLLRSTSDLFSTLTILRAGAVFFNIPNVVHSLAATVRDSKGAIEEKYESVLIDYLNSAEGPQQIAQVTTTLKAVIKLYTQITEHLNVYPDCQGSLVKKVMV